MISFEEYLEECNIEERLKTARLGLLLAVNEKLKGDERLLIKLIIEQDLINETYTLNEESLGDRINKKIQNAKETLKQKGKNALSKAQTFLVKMGNNIKSYISNLIKIIKKEMGEALGKIRKHVRKAIMASNKVKDAIRNTEMVKALEVEMKNFRDMYKKGMQWVKNDPLAAMQKAFFNKAKMEEQLEIEVLNLLTEAVSKNEIEISTLVEQDEKGQPKIPFLTGLVNSLRKIPPFKQLWDFGLYAEKMADNALEKASIFLNKTAGAGGPYNFKELSFIIGLGIEVVMRKTIQYGIVLLIPPMAFIISIISTIETGATILTLIDMARS